MEMIQNQFHAVQPLRNYEEFIQKNDTTIMIVRVPAQGMTKEWVRRELQVVTEQLDDLKLFFSRVFFIPDKTIERIEFEIIDTSASRIRTVESSNIEDIKKLLEDEKRDRRKENPFV